MDIRNSLVDQYCSTHQLGTSVHQFALSKSDIMKLGRELMSQDELSSEYVNVANKMAVNGEIEAGSTFMGVPIVASGK